jgi:hypothetical protein
MVNQRLTVAQEQLSDGLLAAVFVLSFGEVSARHTGWLCCFPFLLSLTSLLQRLARNDHLWSVHMRGLTQLIKLRQANGIKSIPNWFSDVIAL